MKRNKRVFSLVIALVLVLGNFSAAFAADGSMFLDKTDASKSWETGTELTNAYFNNEVEAKNIYEKQKDGKYASFTERMNKKALALVTFLKDNGFEANKKGLADLKKDSAKLAAAVTAMNTAADSVPAAAYDKLFPATDLKVVDIQPVDLVSIKVVFNKKPSEEEMKLENFALSKGTLKAVSNTTTGVEEEILLSVSDVTFEDDVKVTVKKPAFEKTITVPSVDDLYALDMTTNAPSDTIKSDGATRARITCTLREKATGKVVEKYGIVKFQATKGGLAQPTSALIKGVASVDLTSEASAVPLKSVITAMISDVPGAREFEGKSSQKVVKFDPVAVKAGSTTFVSVNYAEAKGGDRFFMTFSEDIKAEDMKAYRDGDGSAVQKDSFGLQIDGQYVKITDVKQITPKALEFILDVDETDSVLIEKPTWTPVAGKGNHLRDNVEHTITIPANIGDLVLANTSGITFMLTDTSKPGIYGVEGVDQLHFKAVFTEPMRQSVATNVNNYQIDGKKLILKPTASAVDVQNAIYGNKIILSKLVIGTYKSADNDERHIVFFELHPDFALSGGVHKVQISNVMDYCGDVHPQQNKMETDTFEFNITVDNSKPVATITPQSPEQWFIEYNMPVSSVTGKVAKDVLSVKTGDEKPVLKYDKDYTVYAVSKDGVVGDRIKKGDRFVGQYFLVEFLKDWTQIYKTKTHTEDTYHAPAKRPCVVTLEHVKSGIGNKADKQELTVDFGLDVKSPTIVNAKDVYSLKDHSYEKNVGGYEAVKTTGKMIFVEFSEPMKVNSDHGSEKARPAEGLTVSEVQQDSALGDVPVSSYEFIKGAKVVKAHVLLDSIAANDYSFVLAPVEELEAGEWIIAIRSITDDIGNALSTDVVKVVVPVKPNVVTNTKTQIAWAAFDDGNNTAGLKDSSNDRAELEKGLDDYDAIYLKFTKVMESSIQNTQNFVFNGKALPEGSKVIQGIKNVTNDFDGVTILMPLDTWDGKAKADKDFTCALNIPQTVKSVDGDVLSGKYEIELTDLSGNASNAKLEAVYYGVLGVFKDAADVQGFVSKAVAKDKNHDGKIEKIELSILNGAVSFTTDDVIEVNGVKYTWNVGEGAFMTDPDDALAGTGRDFIGTFVIEGSDGAILVNKLCVEDKAVPVVVSATLNEEKDELTVKLSETVTKNTDYTFKALEQTDKSTGDFTFTFGDGTVDVALASHGHVEDAADTVVFVVTNGDKVKLSDTVAAKAAVKALTGRETPGADADATAVKISGGSTGVSATNAETMGGKDEVLGVYTLTFSGAWANTNTITIDTAAAITMDASVTDASTAAAFTAANLNGDLSDHYTVEVNGAVLTFTEKTGKATAAALAATNTATGDAAAAETTAGVEPAKEVNTITATGPALADGTLEISFNDGTIDEEYEVAYASGDSADQVAAKIKAALSVAPITDDYVVAAAGATVTITANEAGAVDVTITAKEAE